MTKTSVRAFKIVEVKQGQNTVEQETTIEQLIPMPGSFAHDREAWESIKEPGTYILLPVYELVVDSKPAGDGTPQ